MDNIPHYLVDVLEPDEEFHVVRFQQMAKDAMEKIYSAGHIPIIVGGTGLYINALLDNTEFIESETNLELRAELENMFDEIGGEKMLEKLALFDKETATRLHPNNRRRIIRAFEVYKTTGKTVTEQNLLSHEKDFGITPLVLGITYNDRELLYERINRRVDNMIENGLLQEAKTTFGNGKNKGAFQAIGHKELYGYLKGEISLQEAVECLKQQTRRYAKRQLTWFRRDERIVWLHPDICPDYTDHALCKARHFLKEE